MKKIGELLIDEGFITEIQLQRALEVQRIEEPSTKLGIILVKLGYINQTILDRCLYAQLQHLIHDLEEVNDKIDHFANEALDQATEISSRL